MRLWTRLSIAITALVLVTVAAIAALTYRNFVKANLPRELTSLAADTTHLTDALDNAVRAARADVVIYATANATAALLNASAGSPDPEIARDSRDRLERWFSTELAQKPQYHQIRIIGTSDDGRELVRVDRSGPGDQPRVFGRNEMARRGDRDYFTNGLATPATGVFLSSIELFREDGKIATPIMPLIRVVSPLHRIDGRAVGIVVVNLDLRSFFERIRTTTEPGSAQYLVNAEGDYLVHPDRDKEFGQELGHRHRLQDDFPDIALPGSEAMSRLATDRNGNEFGLAARTLRLAGGPAVTVVKTQAYGDMVAAAGPVLESVVLASLLGGIAALALGTVLSRSLSRPLAQMTRSVEAFASGAPLTLDTGAAGEIGVLARAFKQMADQVNDRTEAMRKSGELLDKTIASIADAVLVVDREGRIIFTNPACRRLFGNRDDLGQPSWQRDYVRFKADGVTPLPPEESPIGLGAAGHSFDALEVVVRVAGKNETHVIVASGRPILDQRGRHEGAVIVYREVTEARAIERQLRQAQQLEAVGQLTGGVAHDFNNILTVIVGMSAVLAEGVADRPKSLDALGMIERAAQRGSDLTRTLLAVARRQALEPRRTDVNALATEATKLLRATLTEAVAIELMLAKDMAPALIDPAQLTTAILNLALNARDAMPDGGKLTIETGSAVLDEDYARLNPGVAPGRYVMVAVSDTGTGMSPAVLEKVFQPFFTTKEQGHGTGLGLSMVYGFIKQSHGHVKIYSELGHGTSVKMYLPLADPAVPDAPAPDATLSAAARQGETILVVEDDELVRRSVIGQLESLGYTVIEAANGADALAVDDRGERFDLLFTDVIMPGGMNGRQLAEAMAARRPGLKVLYTSGYTENAIVHHGRLDPGVHLLNKPYRKADLARMLREVLDKPAP